MYQKVISPPEGDGLVRCATFNSSAGECIVNGSKLHIPQGTVALVYVNGTRYGQFPPGLKTIFTGEDPFFVGLRHIMTHGDPAVTVTVFWVATDRHKFMTVGTGELSFKEKRSTMTLNAFAPCTLTYTVSDPEKLVQKLIGSYSVMITEDDVEYCLTQLVLRPLREALARKLDTFKLTEVNTHLTELSDAITPEARTKFEHFGITLEECIVTAVNFSPESLALLNKLESEIGTNRALRDEVYGGDPTMLLIHNALTNGGGGHGGGLMEYAILSTMIPGFRETLGGGGAAGTTHTDLLSRADSRMPASGLPRPVAGKRCRGCGNVAARNRRTCPVCGMTIS